MKFHTKLPFTKKTLIFEYSHGTYGSRFFCGRAGMLFGVNWELPYNEAYYAICIYQLNRIFRLTIRTALNS